MALDLGDITWLLHYYFSDSDHWSQKSLYDVISPSSFVFHCPLDSWTNRREKDPRLHVDAKGQTPSVQAKEESEVYHVHSAPADELDIEFLQSNQGTLAIPIGLGILRPQVQS